MIQMMFTLTDYTENPIICLTQNLYIQVDEDDS